MPIKLPNLLVVSLLIFSLKRGKERREVIVSFFNIFLTNGRSVQGEDSSEPGVIQGDHRHC